MDVVDIRGKWVQAYLNMIHHPMLRHLRETIEADETKKRIQRIVGAMIIIASFNNTRHEEVRTP